MNVDPSLLTISATKPAGKPARMLAQLGIEILPLPEDEGNVDRYVASKRLAIERRTGSSFLKGIMEKTLFTSAIYLREHFSLPVLIVEGDVNYVYTRFDPQAVRGALSSMILQYGLSVLCTPNVEETVNLIAMMVRQEQVGIPEISLVPKRKAADVIDMQRRLIEMLPGCGMVMAREMLQHFGSVQRILTATKKELLTLRGVGAKKAKAIHDVLMSEYAAVDTEKDAEDAIEARPKLLFDRPVELLARQHYIFTEEKERHIVDMVFLDKREDELILVELKRGKLARMHERQIQRYLDNARESSLLRSHLDRGAAMRGVLATVEPSDLTPKARDVSVRIVDRSAVIRVLKQLRKARLSKR